MYNPKVSIVIPVYNGSNFLQEAINSALAQTYHNCEVIVVNDGSDDGGKTEKIAISYGDKIKYYYKKNGGVATALNFAINKMEGEYFSWLSHDDLYYPQKIERQMKYLKESGDMTRVVYSDFDTLDMHTNVTNIVKLNSSFRKEKLEQSVFSILNGVIHGCTMLIHKSNFERIGYFNENLITTQDYDLWFRMFRGQKLIYIPESLTIARIHSLQGSRTLECHMNEREDLYSGFIDTLTREEVVELYDNYYNFYYQMCCFLKRNGLINSYNKVKNKLVQAKLPLDIYEKQDLLREKLEKFSNGQHKKLCIFGAGEWGTELYFELDRRNIEVYCFCDNDKKKHGNIINDIKCIDIDELYKERSNILVIVAIAKPDEIINQLKKLNFIYITTKYKLNKILTDISPLNFNHLD